MSAATSGLPAGQGDGAAGGFDPSFLGVNAPLPSVGERVVVELTYTHFTVVLDTARALAACAAANVDGAHLVDLPRADAWQLDPRVADDVQTGEEVYAGNDLDRGHLVRRRDPCWGTPTVAQQANIDTFHYVNAAPQVATFNQSKELWLGLETYVLEAAAAAGARLSVLTGPVLAEGDPLYRGVAIPRRFYKIAAWADAKSGALAATGYVLDQSDLLTGIGIGAAGLLAESEPADAGVQLGAYRTYQVPITAIETLTGLGFPALAGADRLPARAGVRADASGMAGWVELNTVEAMTL